MVIFTIKKIISTLIYTNTHTKDGLVQNKRMCGFLPAN